MDTSWCRGLRISGDGSKVICLYDGIIQAWSMWTWESLGKVKLGLKGKLYLDPLCVESSRVWVKPYKSSAQEGWNFGISGSPPVPFNPSTERPYLDCVGGTLWHIDGLSLVKDAVTGKEVFRLSGKIYKT
jgi:hypothetical protein